MRLNDGTLVVSVDDATAVTRVLVEDSKKNGDLYYADRPKGEWIEYESDTDKYDDIRCSCCQRLFTVDSYHFTAIGFTKDDLKYCPYCGADMRGGDNE